jgi:hypothetical protein
MIVPPRSDRNRKKNIEVKVVRRKCKSIGQTNICISLLADTGSSFGEHIVNVSDPKLDGSGIVQ